MEPGGSMLHLQGLSSNPYPYFLRSIERVCSHLRLGLPKGLFPVGLTNSMAYGTRRFNVAFTRALQ